MKLSHDESTRPMLGGHMAQLLLIFGKLLVTKLDDPRIHHEMRVFLMWLKSLAPESLQNGVMALPEEERATLLDVLQGGKVI